AARVRHLLSAEGGITERAMFGGLAFLVDGRMALAVGQGDLMVRVDEETGDRLLEQPDVAQTVMRGRPMRGWFDLGLSVVAADASLRDVVTAAVAHVRTLPLR